MDRFKEQKNLVGLLPDATLYSIGILKHDEEISLPQRSAKKHTFPPKIQFKSLFQKSFVKIADCVVFSISLPILNYDAENMW